MRQMDDYRERTAPASLKPYATWPLLLYGSILAVTGIVVCVITSSVATILLMTSTYTQLSQLELALLLTGSVAIELGILLIITDLFALLPGKRQRSLVSFDNIPNRQLTVVLTAYNDELSIGESVRDFRCHPLVKRIIVIDNNSTDKTSKVAKEAGAIVVLEKQPGYGKCVYRALQEGLAQPDTDLTLLCEGDMTFRAFDIDKFMAYIPHSEIVNGTRIVEQLRDRETQLSTFMYYGNFVVGKLLEAKYVGQGTFTDVGTTYKLCRNAALQRLLPQLNSNVNLEFNAHFLDTALRHRFSLVECPITFHKRLGKSKGGNIDNIRALRVGMRMIRGILFSWKH
jgi:Glycosyl transferase family 2